MGLLHPQEKVSWVKMHHWVDEWGVWSLFVKIFPFWPVEQWRSSPPAHPTKSQFLKVWLETHLFGYFSDAEGLGQVHRVDESSHKTFYVSAGRFLYSRGWRASRGFILSVWTSIYFFFPFLFGIKIDERDINQKMIFSAHPFAYCLENLRRLCTMWL